MPTTPQIISASRRTDIPAFFAEWFLRRLGAGFCDYYQPFSRQWLRVSLLPEDVAGIVLWTKNLAPLLGHLPAVRERYLFYVQFTITGHPRPIEGTIIDTEQAVTQAWEVSRRFGPEALVWRFDPILHTQYGGPEDTIARFTELSAQLEGATSRCVISFMSPYRRQARAFRRCGLEYLPPDAGLRVEMSQRLAAIAASRGMTLSACCNADIVGEGVAQAHCIDAELLRGLGADLPTGAPRGPCRPECGCAKAVDIGAYDLCGGECAYCYANSDHDLAARNRARHDPAHLGLAEAFIGREAGE